MLPTPPPALVEAARSGRLVPFIGAGASRLAGCPGWAEFADAALKFYADRGVIDYSHLDQLKSLPPRVKLSLAYEFQKSSGVTLPVRDLIHPMKRAGHSLGTRLYASIAQLGNTPVTTNYDEWLDEDLSPTPAASLMAGETVPDSTPVAQRTVYCRREEMTLANLNQAGGVLHLHGSITKVETMIVTMRDYLGHYSNHRFGTAQSNENPILSFLEDLFRHKVVLFIGYGLEELEILEYVLLKGVGSLVPGAVSPAAADPQHFILQGFFSHEQERVATMKAYFRTCGVQLIPFSMDKKGYEQLVEVVEYLVDALQAVPLTTLQELTEMERILSD